MISHPPTPSDERQAWFDLTCIMGKGMEELGWNVYNHLPEPWTEEAWKAVKYHDRWSAFVFRHNDSAEKSLKKWCQTGKWLPMSDSSIYLIMLRLYTTIRVVELLYVGPGKYGETIITYPRDCSSEEILAWWLFDWWEDKGTDQLYHEMMMRFWTKHKSMFQPANRKHLPNQVLWKSPKYKQTVG